MAHDPRPHGAFQNGAPASEEDVGVAAHLLKRLQAVKTAGDLPSHKMVRDLPDGGYVIAQDMGGIVKTIIVKPEQQRLEPFEPTVEEVDYKFARLTIPMLYCGHVVEPKPLADGKVKIKLTNTTRRRLGSYDPDKLGPDQIEYKRFTIDYHSVHEAFKPESQGAFFHSQYIDLHPTWWSGAMREVVQVALAYGKQPKGADDDEVPEEERDVLIVPEKYRERIETKVRSQSLPGYKGRPPESGQISFRFDIQKTHGVSFGTDGKPWLIQVDRNGVFAMPLPVIPATTTEAFREWMEDKGDNELLHLIDRFGGVPSGEGFPETEELFEAWKKAGVIIKVCEHGGFYGDEMRSQWQSCGWAFSESGKEGFNTCYSYGSDGVKVGHAFKLKLSLGSHKKEKWTLPDFGDLSEEEALQLGRYLSGLYQALGRGPESLAVKFKLCNSEASDILSRASGGDGAADVDYWRNLECNPIATHSGNIAKVGSGKLYAPWLPASHPQIKFPVAAAKGCISFDFSAERTLDNEEAKKIKCDTIMLGYYVGESLKVVKYFRDARELEPEHSPYDAEGGCMFAGSWESTTTITPTYMWGAFYTTDFDERELAAESESRSVLTAWPGGVSPAYVVPVAYFEVWLSIYRQRAFHNMTEYWARTKYSKYVSVCIPWGNRNAAIHAQLIYPGRREHGVGMFETVELLDSPSYIAGSYMTNWRWIGRAYRGAYGTPLYVYGEGDGAPFVVKEEVFHDFPWTRCGGQSESWSAVGDDATKFAPWVLQFGMAQGPTGGPTPSGDFPAAFHEVEVEGEYERPLDYSSDAFTGRALKKWSMPYFAPSPDQYGFAMKVIGAANACGDAEYSMLTERENTTDPYLSWGNSSLLTKGDIPRFIGVIHE